MPLRARRGLNDGPLVFRIESCGCTPLQGMRPKLWAALVSILSKLGTLQMEQLRNQALVILQR